MPYVFGSKDESIFQERVFANSRTWSPPFNCRAYVTVIGPGGSGGSARGTNADRAHAASGGGGGGCAKSLLILDSSVTYTITIGAGGASVSGAAGNAGGANSVFSGTGISTMTANLGGAGAASADQTTTISTQAGGTGGAASGGTLWNVTGGAGGSATISYYVNSGGHAAAGGGGAAGILGEAFRGGNALLSNAGSDKIALGGGAGVGGRGGDATCTGTFGSGSLYPQASGWGGMGFRDGPDVSTGATTASKGPWIGSPNLGIDMTNYAGEILPWLRAGTMANDSITAYQHYDNHQISEGVSQSIFHGLNGVSGGNMQGGSQRYSGPGAGGSGYYAAGADNYAYQNPGLFGGGGAVTTNYYNEQYAAQNGYGARGSFGAGGGANAAYASSSNVTQSGAGGPGLVVVTILEVL